MKVLVGHHGYFGSVAMPIIIAAGHDAIGLDTYLYEGSDLFEDDVDGCSIRGEIRDVPEESLARYDAIVHFTALPDGLLGEFDLVPTLEINLRATVSFAEKAQEAGGNRLAFASSCRMYGASRTDRAYDRRCDTAAGNRLLRACGASKRSSPAAPSTIRVAGRTSMRASMSRSARKGFPRRALRELP
jgi:nucleoside-diphosphate-sugar epimerase